MQDRLATVKRIGESAHFRGAESLRQLLEYLARQAIEHPGRSVKEYRIAVEALGRREDFDPRVDSSVRVKVARLRAKLADYYATDGRDEPLRIEIPKGSYRLSFRAPTAAEAASEPEPAKRWSLRPSIPRAVEWAAALAVALAAGYALGTSGSDAPKHSSAGRFWEAFIGEASRAVVVYSNARFARSADGSLRPLEGEPAALEAVVDRYTGVGEVMAVHRLNQVLLPLGRQLEVKRALLVDWEDVKMGATIFVGGPVENPGLKELARPAAFDFKRVPPVLSGVNAVIENREPRPGEPPSFAISDIAEHDFAVVRLVPGFQSDSWILVLAGILTYGTQAAVEFITQPEGVEEISKRLDFESTGRLVPFECVLEVGIRGGVPVESQIVAFRRYAGRGESAQLATIGQ